MKSSSICSLIYSSSGCNRGPHTLDWGRNGLLCFAACNAVHLFKYEDHGCVLFKTLNGHKGKVTSVHWIKGSRNEVLSTSADHTACIWTIKENEDFSAEFLVSHKDIVQNASGIRVSDRNGDRTIVATISTDSTLKLWERAMEQSAKCFQTISFGNGFCLDVKFAQLPTSSDLMMLASVDDSKIYVYALDALNQFSFALTLDGHEDWIQCLDVVTKDDYLMVASASQDNYIRLWKISPKLQNNPSQSLGLLKVDELSFETSKNVTYSVSLESVLSGHENRVYSIQWYKKEGSSCFQMLSASMDKTMIIWEEDSLSSMWMEKVRVGEVGGNTLGFYGGVFSPDGRTIVAHSYQGAIHVWKLNEISNEWQPGVTFGGHFSSVCDIDWDPLGEYLVSCSSDQTTRVHAPYVNEDHLQWLEIARPQVHGYDMVCLAVLNRFQLVSAGDEKVLRVFQAPKSFAEALQNISKIDTSVYMEEMVAEGASVPSLGLSNKAVYEEDLNRMNAINENDLAKHPKDRYPEYYYTPLHLFAPPTEETLIQNTLWPEIQKLYGHPYEVFAVASSNHNNLVASACKASKAEHAAIILWDTLSWRQVGKLVFHNLTVTQLQFSPDDEYLLSVSRDRMWAVYKHFPAHAPPYQLIANLEKKNNVHSRIIWSCAWSFDSLYFATASRDKKVAVWGRDENLSAEFSLIQQPLEVEDSATAVSIAPCLTSDKYIVAVGLDKGFIILCSWSRLDGFVVKHKLEENAHHLTVNRLKFSPMKGEAGRRHNSEVIQLASCSNDSHVKIYNVFIQCLS